MRGFCLTFFLLFSLLEMNAVIAADNSGLEFFEKKIRPVLVEQCYKCHSSQGDKPKGGLRLDSRQAVLAGGETGPAVDLKKPEASLLFSAISYSGEASEMPPDGKLSAKIIADFKTWMQLGAPMPVDDGKPATTKKIQSPSIAEGKKFWSFQPAKRIPKPEVSLKNWPAKKLDWFVLSKLEANGLQPSAAADKRDLIRRLHLDLTGLPPTYEAVEAFANNRSPGAYLKLVNQLLESPHYGERWARHWLDVARYAEDNPTSESTCKPPRFAFQYRDWVIAALNFDLPYDEFVKRQLAADLMDGLPPAEYAALGFLGLSPVYHKEPKLSKDVIAVIVADEWDERIDSVTRSFLGLTATCARCHDHKFDPITMHDYYALAGVIAGTQLVEWPLEKTSLAEAEALTRVRDKIVDYELRLNYAKKMQQTAKLEKNDPGPFEKKAAELAAVLKKLKSRKLYDGPIANSVRDAGVIINPEDGTWTSLEFSAGESRDVPLLIRGSVTNPGEIVPRRFLEVLSKNKPKPFGPGSGRLELAESIVNDAASLTARVIVNRVWGWHFGQPLVSTPSNFGKLGGTPTHPKLLDDLAARFIKNGWSLKWLHREIVLSATFRQAAYYRTELQDVDPTNKLLWRMNRRRLEPEVWRDAVLAVSGQLDSAAGGPSADLDDLKNKRRSVYGKVSRQKPADIFRLFDFPDAKRHSDRRVLTTTPLQQLYLLNSEFLKQQAAHTAKQLATIEPSERELNVEKLFQQILLRKPTSAEIENSLQLLDELQQSETINGWHILAHSLLASNEFLFVD